MVGWVFFLWLTSDGNDDVGHPTSSKACSVLAEAQPEHLRRRSRSTCEGAAGAHAKAQPEHPQEEKNHWHDDNDDDEFRGTHAKIRMMRMIFDFLAKILCGIEIHLVFRTSVIHWFSYVGIILLSAFS